MHLFDIGKIGNFEITKNKMGYLCDIGKIKNAFIRYRKNTKYFLLSHKVASFDF